MAVLFAEFKAHEQLDQERLLNLHGRINMIFKVLAWAGPTAFLLLVGIGAWGLNRVFDNQDEQLRLLRSVKAEVVAPPG